MVYVIPTAFEVSNVTLLNSFAPRFPNVIVALAASRNVSVPVPADQSTLSVLALVHEPVTIHVADPRTRYEFASAMLTAPFTVTAEPLDFTAPRGVPRVREPAVTL